MPGEPDVLTIQQAAALTGLTVHTLRYYERIGLLTAINRATNGHRRYSRQNIDRIIFLYRMRQTGMPLDQIRAYAHLLDEGDSSFAARIALLDEQRTNIAGQIAELNKTLDLIDYKLALYNGKIKLHHENAHTGE